jgi:hypothetical protein
MRWIEKFERTHCGICRVGPPDNKGRNYVRALILVAAAALTLSACGGNRDETANADANLMVADNMATMDANMMGTDANMMGGNMGGADMNMATNGATEANMMAQDMNTNAPDTNLANGM